MQQIMNKYFQIAMIILSLVASLNFAQGIGKIKGKVLEANTNDPLIGANVLVDGTSIGTATNIDGEFVLPRLKPDNYTLKITYIGYKGKKEMVTVVANRATEIIITLDWIAVKGDEVLVTAQAKGQLSAINEQLSANELKNVVAKDRIRELPDNNAAEAVGRLPGVSLLRSGGEGNKVVIRGLSPKYSKIMVDGVALAATGSDDRSISMSTISSYSLEGIEVIKSPTANMDGDQVGGSVNFIMRTAPKGIQYEIIAQGGYNDLRRSYNDYMIVGNISNRFFDNSFGVFAQVTIDQKNMSSNSMSAGYTRSDVDAGSSDMKILRITGVGLTNNFNVRERYGATLTLDYLLPDGKIFFKNFLSSGVSDIQTYYEGFWNLSHNFSTSAAINKILMYTNILNYEQYLSIFKVNAKLSHSFSGSEMPSRIGLNFSHSPDVEHYPDDTIPEDVPGYANNEYEKFLWNSVTDDQSSTKGRQLMAQLDFETDFSVSKQISGKIKFGGKFRYDERSYDRELYGGMPKISNSSGKGLIDSLYEQIPRFNELDSKNELFWYPSFFDHDFSHGNFLNGNFQMGPVADIELMRQIVDIMQIARIDYLDEGAPQESDNYFYHHKSSVLNDYSGIERLGAGYIMAEFNIGEQIKFIPGVRYEAKETIYNGVVGYDYGLAEFKYAYSDTTSKRTNDFWLPMIHFRYEPLDWLQVRLAYTRTLARPSFRNILPSMNIDSESLTMNNPSLRPESAESFDVYFAFSGNYLGLFTVGGFYKSIQDKIFSRGKRILNSPEEYGLDPKYKGIDYFTQENNENLTTVKGFEIDWQTNFWYLPYFLKGLVLNVNYTKIFSKALYPKTEFERYDNPNVPPKMLTVAVDASYEDRMQHQPNDIVNLGIGYDYEGFSARLSMNYSSDIFISSSFYRELRSLTDDYLRWDLAISQKLPWIGLQVYFNVTNLSNAIEKSFRFGGHKPRAWTHYGRALYGGIRLRIGD